MKKIISSLLVSLSFGVIQANAAVSAEDLVKHCLIKNQGADQRTRLKVTTIDASGAEATQVYHRYWKDYPGASRKKVTEKMLLFAEFPPDIRGTAFMRWAYPQQSSKKAEQWIYLPSLKKIRRVTVRDLSQRFLGTELTYADITPRSLDMDKYKIAGKKGEYVKVVSEPKEKDIYSRREHIFKLGRSAEQCVVVRTDYFDRHGQHLKTQNYTWQQMRGAWVWKKVLVVNVQSERRSLFEVDDVAVNTGISDEYFAERTLRGRGLTVSGLVH